MAYEPTLTAFTDANPMPRVEVLFSSFDPATAFVTVYRLAEDREYKVRGAVMAPTAGSLTRIDSEVPFGVVATYRAEMFDDSGASLGFTGTAAITLNVDDTWVHNPLDPSGGLRMQFRGSAATDLVRPTDGEVFFPLGRRVGVVISGQRRGLVGVPLDMIVDSPADADQFQRMLGDYASTTVPVLCIRIGATARARLPRPLFAAVLEAHEMDVNYTLGTGSTIAIQMTGDEVSPPAAGIIIPLLSRADINASYATNAAIAADNLTRLAVNRRYDLAGAAG